MIFQPNEHPDGSAGKEPTCNAGDAGIAGLIWRRKVTTVPVFLPEKSHRQRSPEGHGSKGPARVGHD